MTTILVVDDRYLNRQYLTTLFNNVGINVLEAADGKEALKLARSEHPDLVITDILMPTMDGVELVKALRSEEATSGTPVVFYTATFHAREARTLAASCGVLYVLCKPCEPQEILNVVAQAIGERISPQAASASGGPEDVSPGLLVGKLVTQAAEPIAVGLRLAALVEFSLELNSESEPEHLLEVSCAAAQDIIGARLVALGIRGKGGAGWRHFIVKGADTQATSQPGRPLDADTLDRLVKGHRSLRLSDAREGPGVAGVAAQQLAFASLLSVPIASASHVHGWLCLCDKVGATGFSEEDEQLALTLAAQVAVAYENTLLQASLREQAAQLQASLKEKEVLLREIHHRVKNNLQIVSSLLVLQASYIDNEHERGAFLESTNRIKLMALIHDVLYQSGDLTYIDIGQYIKNVASDLVTAYVAGRQPIRVEVDSCEALLDVDTVMYCGLVINELVSGFLKQPYGGAGERLIRIALMPRGRKQLELEVSDSALAATDGVPSTSGLGLNLVNIFAQKLKGTIEVDTSAGTVFRLTFPRPA